MTSTTVQKLHELSIEVLSHPPYSPDLSPSDYHLANFLTRKRFKKQEDIENAFQQFLSSRDSDFYTQLTLHKRSGSLMTQVKYLPNEFLCLLKKV
ncbi:Histone-lysine N-methyltransferase SETMAR [Habropoda laboriosa]|uniref:Histone-lysine N-methyltransferase SETMAR n=1 Tax=Habropoda laboriosa TaxID=597456 RepID=A0A0L7R2U7_9HYME|nr:Histone-lysine N-methyltransferase SETMAR [Habropoda laboriosa]